MKGVGVEFIINGQKLDLCGVKIQYQMINPLFDEDGLPRVFTTTFSIDATPHNLQILDYANRLDSTSTEDTFICQNHLGGMPFQEGYINVCQRTDKGFKLYFENLAGRLADKAKDKSLQNLDMGKEGVTIVNDTIFEATIIPGAISPSNLGIMINGKRYETGTFTVAGIGIYTALAALINADYPTAASVNNVVPFSISIDQSAIGNHDVIFDCFPQIRKVFEDIPNYVSIHEICESQFIDREGVLRLRIDIDSYSNFIDYNYTNDSTIEDAIDHFINVIHNQEFGQWSIASKINYSVGDKECLALKLDFTRYNTEFLGYNPLVYNITTINLNESTWSITSSSQLYSEKVRDAWDAYMINYSNTSVLGETISYPTIRNTKFYDNQNPLWQLYCNFNNQDNYPMNMKQCAKQFRYNLTPMVNHVDVLDAIADLGGLDIIGAFINRPEIQQLIVYSINSIDDIRAADECGKYVLNCYLREFEIAKQLPDFDVLDFWKAFAKWFCIAWYPTSSTLEAIQKKEILATRIIDWTTKVKPDYTFKNIYDQGTTFDLTHDPDDDKNIDGVLEQLVIGDGEQEVIPELSTLYEIEETAINTNPDRAWRIPEAIQVGNSTAYNNNQNDFLPRLLFFLGFATDINGADYPYADYISAVHSLDWNGADGMYETYWKEWRDFINKGKDLTMSAALNILDILNLQNFRQPRRLIRHSKGQVVGIIKRVSFSSTESRISESKVQFHTQ